MSKLKDFLKHELYTYDKQKMNLLKAILPLIIIIHHIAPYGYNGIQTIASLGDIVMYIFFAMSGYGLVTSYLRNDEYLNGFLKKSLTKLFIPYLVAMLLFVVYRYINGIDNIELLKTKGLFYFVPTSWYIYVLSYFYIFFFIVFKYAKTNNIIKVLLVCLLIYAYCLLTPTLGIESWRYNRCPAFCIGMIFALCDKYIRSRFVRRHILLVLFFLICIYPLRYSIHWRIYSFLPLYYATIFFLFMYIIGNVKQLRITKFLSSISLEMFIIQYIPIYIFVNNLNLTSTTVVVSVVIILDIIIAYLMHKAIKPITKRII